MILAAWYHVVLALVFAVVTLLLMIVVLLQRGRGVGLAGAFGGAGGTGAFGAKTGDFLTWVTIVGAGIYLLFAVILNFVFVPPKSVIPTPPASSQPAGGAPTGAWRLLDEPDPAIPVYAGVPIFGFGDDA